MMHPFRSGQVPLLLHNHKDDNFKRKSKYKRGVPPSIINIFIIIIINNIICVIDANSRSQFTIPCNRSRSILTELSGSISDGPSYLNYTGIFLNFININIGITNYL